jgi:hypothetical protein
MPHTHSVPVDARFPVIICDPLHLMTRIRSRWVPSPLSIDFGADFRLSFSTEMIQSWNILPPVVFLNSRITTMHDSFPPRLFSPLAFAKILVGPWPNGTVPTPWFMLTSPLTLTGDSTASHRRRRSSGNRGDTTDRAVCQFIYTAADW